MKKHFKQIISLLIALSVLFSSLSVFAKETSVKLKKNQIYTERVYLKEGQKLNISIRQTTKFENAKIKFTLDDGKNNKLYKSAKLCYCDNPFHNTSADFTTKTYKATKSGWYNFVLRCCTKTSSGISYEVDLTVK